MKNEDYRIMFDLLEWEIEEEIKNIDNKKSSIPKKEWKIKRNVYLDLLEKIRYTQKGAG